MDDLEKLLNGEVLEPTPSEPAALKPTEEQIKNDEATLKTEQLENLNKAILEAQGKLKDLRKAKKAPVEEEEIPKINMEDPSAKAWDKHIRENVNPLQANSDQEREEVRGIALKRFLSDKPALARNPDKVKELMENYQALSNGKITEKVSEVVEDYLNRAYAATFPTELLNAARNQRMENAQNDILFSDAAVSRGSTGYSAPKDEVIRLTDEEKLTLAKWGYPVEDYIRDKKEAAKKAALEGRS